MKRKTASMQPKVETLELPSENTERLNSLAKALIKEAIVNNKARKDMYELIDELWNETFFNLCLITDLFYSNTSSILPVFSL